jgi:hypothetical protein
MMLLFTIPAGLCDINCGNYPICALVFHFSRQQDAGTTWREQSGQPSPCSAPRARRDEPPPASPSARKWTHAGFFFLQTAQILPRMNPARKEADRLEVEPSVETEVRTSRIRSES